MSTNILSRLHSISRGSVCIAPDLRIAALPNSPFSPQNRWQGSHQTSSANAKQQISLEEAKPYKEMPTMAFFKTMYTMYKNPEFQKTHVMFKSIFTELGDIVKSKIPFGPSYVMVRNPEDIKALLAADGKYPAFPGFDFFVLYRGTYRKDLYPKTSGLVGSQGEAWYEFRSAVQQDMMRPKSAMFYLDEIADISSSLVDLLAHKMEPNDKDGFIGDVTPLLHRWALEATGAIFLDYRIGGLEPNLTPDSEPIDMINCVNVVLGDDMQKIMQSLPLYKVYATKPYRNFDQAHTKLHRISKSLIKRAMDKFKQESEKNPEVDPNPDEMSVLQKLIRRCGPDSEIPLVMAMDALLAGVDTTGNSASFLLYHMASNPDKQEILYQEIVKVIGTDPSSPVKEHHLEEMKYLKAFRQESQRLMPAVGGLARTLHKDIVLSGYRVPAGTFVAVANIHNMRSAEFFNRPEDFEPERWLRNRRTKDAGAQCPHDQQQQQQGQRATDPHAYLPFGHGPRMCIGRRFAVMELHLLAVRLLQRYRLVYEGKKPLDMLTPFVNRPEGPVKIRFIKR